MSQTAERVRWTIRDLEVMPQNEGARYELINGELFVTSLPHRRHQQVSGTIFAALNSPHVARLTYDCGVLEISRPL